MQLWAGEYGVLVGGITALISKLPSGITLKSEGLLNDPEGKKEGGGVRGKKDNITSVIFFKIDKQNHEKLFSCQHKNLNNEMIA